ncbi:LSM domain-containing protein [Lasiosphaeris hirsuta]|uniref:LSM domain-containing protein n=1 Tax=Lasiosphaeris hirsuta TaxID=260670 RepID=A0AA40EDA9_9PEZI|nr:LSM domain-containing protein [Lasiosphaeris hirsuta]
MIQARGVAADAVSKQDASDYLQSLLNKNLRVTTTDSRMFWGGFKCTDSESNIVLKHTYEYRHPSLQKQAEELAGTAATSTVKMDMTSRYLGLVVVPGKHIVKIEVEEFKSQMKSRDKKRSGEEWKSQERG